MAFGKSLSFDEAHIFYLQVANSNLVANWPWFLLIWQFFQKHFCQLNLPLICTTCMNFAKFTINIPCENVLLHVHKNLLWLNLQLKVLVMFNTAPMQFLTDACAYDIVYIIA